MLRMPETFLTEEIHNRSRTTRDLQRLEAVAIAIGVAAFTGKCDGPGMEKLARRILDHQSDSTVDAFPHPSNRVKQ